VDLAVWRQWSVPSRIANRVPTQNQRENGNFILVCAFVVSTADGIIKTASVHLTIADQQVADLAIFEIAYNSDCLAERQLGRKGHERHVTRIAAIHHLEVKGDDRTNIPLPAFKTGWWFRRRYPRGLRIETSVSYVCVWSEEVHVAPPAVERRQGDGSGGKQSAHRKIPPSSVDDTCQGAAGNRGWGRNGQRQRRSEKPF